LHDSPAEGEREWEKRNTRRTKKREGKYDALCLTPGGPAPPPNLTILISP
jgi:hypothetical protein